MKDQLIKTCKVMKRGVSIIAFLFYSSLAYGNRAYAIQDSKLVSGTKELFQDIATSFIILAPIVGGAVGAFFFFQLQTSDDESDIRILKKKIKTIVIATIGVFVFGSLITVITNYYK